MPHRHWGLSFVFYSFNFQSVISFRKGNTQPAAMDAGIPDWNGPNVNISCISGFVAFSKWPSICIMILNIGDENQAISSIGCECKHGGSHTSFGDEKEAFCVTLTEPDSENDEFFASHTFGNFSSHRCNKWNNLYFFIFVLPDELWRSFH